MPEESPTPTPERRLNVFALPNQTTILVILVVVVLFGTLAAISINAPFAIFWPLTVALLLLSLRSLIEWPEREIGRRYLRLSDARFTSLQQRVDALAKQIGLTRTPMLLVVPEAAEPQVVGALRRRYIVLSETVASRILKELYDPELTIDANWVLLHELSHFRHGDTLQTGYARALLRAGIGLVGWATLFFLGLTLLLIAVGSDLLPYNPEDLAKQFDARLPGVGVYNIVITLLGSNAEWEEVRQKAATINLGMITFFTFLNTFPVALLSAVLLTAFWYKILRLRELYADAGAAQALGTTDPLSREGRLRGVAFDLGDHPQLQQGRLRRWFVAVADEARAFWFNLREVPGIRWIWGFFAWLRRKHYSLERRQRTLAEPRLLYDSWFHGWKRSAWMTGALVVTLELLLMGTSALFFIGAWPMHLLVITSVTLLGLDLMVRSVIERPTYRSILVTAWIILIPHTGVLLLSLGLLWLLLLTAPALLTDFLNAAVAAIAGFAGFLTTSQIDDPVDLVSKATVINLSQILVMFSLVAGSLLLWLLAVRRTLRWYRLLHSSRDWKRIAYSLLTLLILALAFGVLPLVTNLVTWRFESVWNHVPALIATALLAILAAVSFWWTDRHYADCCPYCGDLVEDDYRLGATCPHCRELLHPWLFATYHSAAYKIEQSNRTTLQEEGSPPLAEDGPQPKTA